MFGKIKFYKGDRGFGFIAAEDGKDIFFHISDVVGDHDPRILKKDTTCQFNKRVFVDRETGDAKVKAVDVKVL
ncbi:MAG: cold shock domain-containing protein [Clostridiales bacterium]|nr:cold shock domain-containing protein [Candidatus Cacconaster stercorequi]